MLEIRIEVSQKKIGRKTLRADVEGVALTSQDAHTMLDAVLTLMGEHVEDRST